MTRPNQHRAFTLIEVLAATVLLAMLSGVCAGLLRDVGPSSLASQEHASFEMFELERFADAVLFQSEDLARLDASEPLDVSLPWRDATDRPPVRIRSVPFRSGGQRPLHAWLAFSCESCVVWRCVSLRQDGKP